jgi:hypothetical protein
MSKIKHLTLEEHTEVGAMLAAIAVPTWDGRRKSSRISHHCRRASKYLSRLRHDLIDLVCDRYDTWYAAYGIHKSAPVPNAATADHVLAIREQFYAGMNKINGRVPAGIIDRAIRVDRALNSLHWSLIDALAVGGDQEAAAAQAMVKRCLGRTPSDYAYSTPD